MGNKSFLSVVELAMPVLIFMSSVFFAALSGNDKAPFIVILALVINSVMVVTRLRACLRSPRPRHWLSVYIAAAPIIYAVTVIILARAGVLDPLYFIGFR